MTAQLRAYRKIWERKPVVRQVYRDFHARMTAACRQGRTLEVGAGIGNFGENAADTISCDIQEAPWLDVVADGQLLPFGAGTFDNIVVLDVIHHLAAPLRFFREAVRVLRPGGRVVIMEPGITPLSHLFLKLFHQEPVVMDADPFADEPAVKNNDPYEANQAIPELMFVRSRARFEALVPELPIERVERLSLWTYPLSGGFKRWSLVPRALAAPLLAVEKRVLPLIGPFAAFRLLVVLERV